MSNPAIQEIVPEIQAENGELPEGWLETTLDQLLQSLESGSRPRGGVRGIKDGIPSIGGEHLSDDGGFRFEKIKFVPKEYFERMNHGHVSLNDILIVKDGATTGKVSLVRDDFPYKRAVVNEHVFLCRFMDCLYAPFIFYFLFSEIGQKRVLENFRGSAQGGINQSFAPGTMIPVAPLTEQKRIVAQVEALLARVNAARARLAKVPAILKRFRQSVLAAACSGQLTADWREENGEGGWQQVPLSNVVTEKPRNGYSPKPVSYETPIRSLTLSATTSGSFKGEYFKYVNIEVPQDSYLWIKNGDILIQRGNTSEYVGVSAIYEGEDDKYIYPDLMIKIRPNKKIIIPKFLWLTLSMESTRNYFRNNATGTAGSMPKINQKIVQSTPIALPLQLEQTEIVRRVETLFALADRIEQRAKAATERVDKTTQSILARAFRGELVETEAELARREDRDYESAAELLARIQAERDISASTKPRRKSRARRSAQ